MSRKRVPIKISKIIEVDNEKKSVKSEYSSNIRVGDVLQYIIVVGCEIVRKTYFHVEECGGWAVKVKFKKDGKTQVGQLDYRQLLGSINPSPENEVITHFAIIRN